MKKNKAWVFLSMFAIAVGCQDDDEPANSITSEEAAVIVSSSLAANTSGVSFVSGKAADVTEDLLEDNAGGRVAACGLSQNLDLSGASPDGAAITYSYDFSYKFKLSCNTESEPSEVSVNLSYSGEFDAPKIAADHSGIAELDVTGLEAATEEFLFNGLFKRSGSFENKEQAHSANSSIEITLKDVTVKKGTHQIQAGTGTFVVKGNVPSKGDFNYTGSITFLGADSAELNVSGNKFTANLKSSEVTKKN
ncbi:MAG TPA: hypothetical protein VK589_15435 [Chryseolinea sp.]|nr:hypothetical protein [Chryseolinea sp.]